MSGSNELRITSYELRIGRIFCVLLLCILGGSIRSVEAQSTNQSFPTAITTNEISGKIPARDIGDARLTSYFYVFNAAQGDVFINVVTTNLNGDIDIFTADNLRPLAKITLYADASDNETGRVVYLRQPTKLILRIEGRTPNDDAAIFRVKFAGSFAPANLAENPESETPQIKTDNQTDIRVNSVGTIIEIKPKPLPTPKQVIAEIKTEKEIKQPTKTIETKTEAKESEKQATVTEEKKQKVADQEKPTVVVTDEIARQETTAAENQLKKDLPVETSPIESIEQETVAKEELPVKTEPKKVENPKKLEKPKPLPLNALENIRLIILFKDGSKIERPMSEVLKVGVDKGILTIISKDGAVGRYSILDVEKMTIE